MGVSLEQYGARIGSFAGGRSKGFEGIDPNELEICWWEDIDSIRYSITLYIKCHVKPFLIRFTDVVYIDILLFFDGRIQLLCLDDIRFWIKLGNNP